MGRTGTSSADGRDVAARVTATFFDDLERRGISVDALAEGTGVPLAAFRDPKGWLPWPAYQRMLENVTTLLTDDQLRDLGHQIFSWPLFRVFWIAGWMLPSQEHIIRWFARHTIGPGAALFPTSQVEVEPRGPGAFRVRFRAPPGGEVPRAWTITALCVLEDIPRLLGRPPARARLHASSPGAVVMDVEGNYEPAPVFRRAARAVMSFGRAPSEVSRLMEDLLERNRELGAALVERERAERERQVLEERLARAQRLEALGRLAGGIAHDFNNLLAVIVGSGALLAQDTPEDDPRRVEVEAIQEAAARGTRLVRQLLAFSVERPPLTERVDLGALVQGMGPVLTRLFPEGAHLEIDAPTELPAVLGDAGQLEQVVLNLVVNARDAVRRGGRVSVAVQRQALAEERPDLELGAGAYVVLTVQDDGAGMDDATRSRAFDPFFTTKKRDGGTGLGLSTVFAIVRQHDGAVELQSAPGRGTTVRVYLRAHEGSAARVPVTREAPAVSPARHILLVEDDPSVRVTLRRMLESAEVRVTAVASAEEALEVFRTHRTFDVLVTDVHLPGEDGVSLAHRIREHAPGFPVVVMTGHTERAVPEDATMRLLEKPFPHEALAGALASVLSPRA